MSKVRLYKFYPPEYVLDNLRNNWLKLSRLHELNDPFEFNCLNISDNSQKKAFDQMRESIWSDKGIVSFSKQWSNPVLWAHYAANHKGLALGFDVAEKYAIPVKYVNAKMDFDYFALTPKDRLQVADDLVRTKFSHWSYEDEYRIVAPFSDCTTHQGLLFLNCNEDIKLREVIIGMKSSLLKAQIKRAARNKIRIIVAQPDQKTFNMIAGKAG